MVEEHHLSIVITLDLNSFNSVTWWVLVWINIDHLSVPLVSEQKTSVRIGINSEIRGVVQSRMLGIPVEET